MVAMVPRKRQRKTAFHVLSECPYDLDGTPFDTEDGKSWSKLITGVPDEAVAQTPDQELAG
jgi:hypothetical protein